MVTYPGGTVVPITPNAYGEAEAVGSYATSIDYWPNGSIEELQDNLDRHVPRHLHFLIHFGANRRLPGDQRAAR